MKYIDSGSRDPATAIATWLQAELAPNVVELRWQAGFFSLDGLHLFVPVLQRLASANLPVHALIGSNDGETLEPDVVQLATLMGVPRSHAHLGIVSYAGSYFHPKTYHLKRSDGSQAAYVGSANLTLPGIASLHVEAGIIVDTLLGDPSSVLDEVAQSIDNWFLTHRAGLEEVLNPSDVTKLTAAGVLVLARAPRLSPSGGRGGLVAGLGRPRLQPLVSFPRMTGAATPPLSPTPGSSGPAVAAVPAARPVPQALASVPKSPPYPEYILFAPGAASPTSGATGLSGATLPGSNAGLIIRLNRDSARHWSGKVGTSNISIPVPTISTLRFGLFRGSRPRCEFQMQMRFLYPGNQLLATPITAGIMTYGFTPGDTGHNDVRLVVPLPPARELAGFIRANGRIMPAEGDFALLEWPTASQPTFWLSLLEKDLPIYQQAQAIFAASDPVGKGACWLAQNISPDWP